MLITVSSCSDNMGVVTGSGSFLVGDTDTLTATANYGYHFVRWSDNNTENPRVLVYVQDSTLVAIFEPNEYTLICNNGVGGGVYPYLSQVEIHALPQGNLQFRGWSDSIMDNPRTVTVLSDTTFSAVFTSPDTTYIHDTTTINDSVYVDVFVHDTIYVPIFDTTYIDVHDTTYIDNYIYDTTIVVDTVRLTEYVPVHDTTYIEVHDTTYINNYIHDTIIVNNYIHDTTYLWQYDTTYIDNYIHDTTIVDNWIYDTTIVVDTLWIQLYDTVWLTLYDTVRLHDTVIIHDTIYITQEGIGDEAESSIKLYQKNGQIVVEGAAGKAIYMYDINGRLLMRRTENEERRTFDVPVSGAYLIKVGELPARKIVVIR